SGSCTWQSCLSEPHSGSIGIARAAAARPATAATAAMTCAPRPSAALNAGRPDRLQSLRRKRRQRVRIKSVRRTLRILRVALALLSLLLCIASVVLWIRSLLAPPAAATGLVNLRPYPDRWFLYAQGGTMLLARERSILDAADVPRGLKSGIDKRSVLGFGI